MYFVFPACHGPDYPALGPDNKVVFFDDHKGASAYAHDVKLAQGGMWVVGFDVNEHHGRCGTDDQAIRNVWGRVTGFVVNSRYGDHLAHAVAIEHLYVGDMVANVVLHPETGEALTYVGQALHEAVIDRLQEHGVDYVLRYALDRQDNWLQVIADEGGNPWLVDEVFKASSVGDDTFLMCSPDNRRWAAMRRGQVWSPFPTVYKTRNDCLKVEIAPIFEVELDPEYEGQA